MSSQQPRLPEVSDFPSDMVLTIIPPPLDPASAPSNILILLHGLGDGPAPFAALGKNLNLPETACIALKAPNPLPFEPTGAHWGDDLIFDSSTGGLDADAGFGRAAALLRSVIEDVLVAKCGWRREAVFFLGFGQGGMVALAFAVAQAKEADGRAYGGVVSIGGPLPVEAPSLGKKCGTPVLVCAAERGSDVTEEKEKRLTSEFEAVTVVRWKRTGDGMMRNAEEARPVMEFFARRLRSRKGVPEGAVEL